MTKEIRLTQGLVAIVDDENFEYLNQYKWFANYNKRAKSYYALTQVKINGKFFLKSMHRVIMNAQAGFVVDHVNHETLYNVKSNLRICTNSQNRMNSIAHRSNNTSGYKGVTKESGRWRAQISLESKNLHLGIFDTPEEAAHAYDEAAIKYYGEFSNLNFLIDE